MEQDFNRSAMGISMHEFLDFNYGPDGDQQLLERLAEGTDVNARVEGETPLHVAVRRRRENAVGILLDHHAEIDARNGHGKTGYAHALRRGFNEVASLLEQRGADTTLNDADRLAVAIVEGRLDDARSLMAEHPGAVRTGNPEEDRLLADMAGRSGTQAVKLLIDAGADLAAPGLDTGTPLHQTAWFGQPANARLLIEAGAPLNVFDRVHQSSPLGWAVHGSRYSGGAPQRQSVYRELVQMLLDAGSSLRYPEDSSDRAYLTRLHKDATDDIRPILPPIPD